MRTIIALFSLTLAGCSTLSHQECITANWFALGELDGSKGRSLDVYRDYQKDCAAFDVRADFAEFKRGYQQGLVSYCNYENGKALGQSGAVLFTGCVNINERDFKLGFEQGHAIFKAQSVIDNVEHDIAHIKQKIEQNEQQIEQNKQTIADAKSTPEQRKTLLDANDKLRNEIAKLNHQLPALYDALATAEQNLYKSRGR